MVSGEKREARPLRRPSLPAVQSQVALEVAKREMARIAE